MNVIAEITKANSGTLGSVLRRVSHHIGDDDTVTVLLLDRQLPELAIVSGAEKFRQMPISAMAPLTEVALELVIESANNVEQTVCFSFEAPVLALSSRLPGSIRNKVQFCPWSKAQTFFENVQSGIHPGAYVTQNPSTQMVSDTEAFSLLKQVLQKNGATHASRTVKKTNLRPLMSDRDVRFSKTHPATSKPNYITELLFRAKANGLIGMTLEPYNANIWLLDQQSVPVANVLAATQVTNATPTIAVLPSERYIDPLRRAGMGPFPNVRDDLYNALEKAAANDLTLDRVITECIVSARDAHQESKDKTIPWNSVRQFFVELLRRSPVLLDGNQESVKPSFQTQRTKIAAVATDFRNGLDGELILFLLENGAEISYADIPVLVSTLYMTRETRFENRLNDVLAQLHARGAIVYGECIQLATPVIGNVTKLPLKNQ